MKFAPETRDEPNAGVPSAQPGIYTMVMTSHKEDVKTKYGLRDVIDFQGDNAEGVTVGCSLWIKGPERRDDGGMTKGNLWMYRQLAEACGPDALEQYRSVDENGHSKFRPLDWRFVASKGHPRYFTVEVGLTRVESVRAADPELVRLLHPETDQAATGQATTGSAEDRQHDSGLDDDIPF